MAASHIPEGRRRTEWGQVIFILGEPKGPGRTFRHEQVCHGAEWSRNLKNVREKVTPERFENAQVSSLVGTRNTIRRDAQPKMNYFYEPLWQLGEGWTEIKGFAFLLAWFPGPDSLLVMITARDSCFILCGANTNTVHHSSSSDRAFSQTAALCLVLRAEPNVNQQTNLCACLLEWRVAL